MDLRAWLRDLGLEQYAPTFRSHDIDADVVRDLTEADLERIGISLGHRKKLLRAIAILKEPERLEPRRGAEALSKPTEAERRHLTILFCDLVGSTALSSRLDPEDMREVIQAFQQTATETIIGVEGHVAKYMGDGLLAYFGWPRAHEDEAERAVRAGLNLVTAIAQLTAPDDSKLACRVGIATGPVIIGDRVGEGAAQEEAVIGETPNLAARLQAAAAPGEVVIASATRRLLSGLFTLRDLGFHELKGFAAPVQAWCVLGESSAASRFAAHLAGSPTPLVGRHQEISLLADLWNRARAGSGQVVSVSGEAGIGKSRLIQALQDRLAQEPHTCLVYQCSPFHQQSALHPVTAQIARTADFDSKDPPDTKLDKLERLLARSGASIEGTAPLLAALVSVPCDQRYPPMDLSARRQKDATFEVLTEHLTRLASHQPVLMIVEDVHWADPTTLEFLGQVVQRLHSMRMLAVFTFRPEFRPPWSAPGRTSRIALGRLSQPERRELVARLAYGASLPNQALEQIAAKTDGVPLFVEELTKAVLEARTAAQRPDGLDPGDPALILPDSLQDSLMARLDHLATVRETAQIGAVIGREFSHELLAAVARRDERDLQSDLDRLVEAGLIFAQKPAPGTSYAFKHALVRDAAYATLLRARRRQLHTQVAQVLEKQFSEIVEREPETIARHYEAAGLDLQAILYWLRAGEWASDRSANAEAESHLRRALVLIEKLPDRSEHQQLELRALTALGHVLIAKSGYGSPDVETIYSRANRLCETIGQEATVFPILLGLAIYSAVRAELDTGLSLSRRLVDLADQASDAVLKVEAHYSAGIIHHWRGEFVRARHHLTSAAEMYRTEQHKTHLAIYGQDPGPICLCRGAAVLWHLGYPDQAQAQMEDALRLADQLSHPFSRTYVLAWAAWLRILRREVTEAEQLIGLATWFAREQGYPYWIALMTQYEGWLLAQKGDPHLAIARLEKGLLETHAVGTRVTCAYASGLLGQELAKVGRASDGVHLIEQALDHVRTRQERWCEAELLRLQGEVLLTVGLNDCNAEAAMRLATGRAQEQNAKGWELRATTSLARLWAEQGQRAKARDILGPVYHWFTEGFHTTDLKEARDLLETLT